MSVCMSSRVCTCDVCLFVFHDSSNAQKISMPESHDRTFIFPLQFAFGVENRAAVVVASRILQQSCCHRCGKRHSCHGPWCVDGLGLNIVHILKGIVAFL